MPGRIARLALYDTLRALNTWRWFAVPPVFILGGWLGASHAEYVMEVLLAAPLRPNFWDGALILPTKKYAITLGFVLGFLLVTGDSYVRDHHDGTASLTLLRSCSRVGWWSGKVLGLAFPALAYSILAYTCALIGSILVLPVESGASQAATIPWGYDGGLYPRFEWMPTPLFFLLVVVYTAFALWAVGSLTLAVSALHPHYITPFVVALAWVLVGTQLRDPLSYTQETPPVNPVYHVSYVTNFVVDGNFSLVPWFYALGVLGCTLLLAFVIGTLCIYRADI